MGIFTSGKADENRLQTIQDFTDQFTHEGIAACDLPTNADCLEVGAGQGSVALWLAQRFTHGTVVAVDLDTEALEPLAQAQAYLQAVKSDISVLDYPAESFDLIHARFVLSHLANRDELVSKFATWLRPGGYLVVTDAYQLPTETSPHPIVARVFGAYVNYAQSGGMDLQWVRSAPSVFARAGLGDVAHQGRTTYLGGGESDRWAPLIAPFADALVAAGTITEADKTEFFDALQDPTVLDIPQIIITVTGRKP